MRTSEARKREEDRAAPLGGWSAVLLLDGVPVTGEVPIDDWCAATVASPLLASWIGEPVSITNAVVGARAAAALERESVGRLFGEAS